MILFDNGNDDGDGNNDGIDDDGNGDSIDDVDDDNNGLVSELYVILN